MLNTLRFAPQAKLRLSTPFWRRFTSRCGKLATDCVARFVFCSADINERLREHPVLIELRVSRRVITHVEWRFFATISTSVPSNSGAGEKQRILFCALRTAVSIAIARAAVLEARIRLGITAEVE
jgi:hypothetical protein